MAWEVEFTEEFGSWWETLTDDQQDDVAHCVELLGDKTGDDRWYDKSVPVADRLYDQHLEELKKEGKC